MQMLEHIFKGLLLTPFAGMAYHVHCDYRPLICLYANAPKSTMVTKDAGPTFSPVYLFLILFHLLFLLVF